MTADGAARCPIFLAPVVDPGCCDGCNQPLPARRRRWCSDPCWQTYFANHTWTTARNEALRRVTVFVPEERPEVEWDNRRYRSVTTGRTIAVQVAVWRPCDRCGRDTLEGEHSQRWYRSSAKPLELAAEVNHVEPRMGQGYDEGCWNHQTNLQVLCHACHVEETIDQRLVRSVSLALDTGRLTPEQARLVLTGRAAQARLQVVSPHTLGAGLDLIVPLWDQP